jgi:hypothetical protein
VALKIVVDLDLLGKGWTETWYNQGSSNPRGFLTALNVNFWNVRASMLCAGGFVVSARASVIGKQRVSFDLILNLPSPSVAGANNAPLAINNQLNIQLYSAVGHSRHWALRGFDRADVTKDPTTGAPQLSGLMSNRIASFVNQLALNQLQIQYAQTTDTAGFEWVPCLLAVANPIISAWTDITVPAAKIGNFSTNVPVYFKGVNQRVFPGLKGKFAVVQITGGNTITIPYKLNPPPTPVGGKMFVRPYLPQYDTILSTGWQFVDWTTRKTGEAFPRSRGRNRAAVQRQ